MSTPEAGELDVLNAVAGVLASEGVRLNAHQYEPPPLTVDFVFDEAEPAPLAIEITRLLNPSEAEGDDALMKHLVEPLGALASEEQWGCWAVAVSLVADMRELRAAVTALIREGNEIRPGNYISEDLLTAEMAGELHSFLASHCRLVGLGLVEVSRCIDPELRDSEAVQRSLATRVEHEVKVLGVGGARPITGVTASLYECFLDNSGKLAAARPRQTHLAVEILRWDAARSPNDTPVPPLPTSVDRIWVLHRWAHHRDEPDIWWATADALEWETAYLAR